MTLFQNDAETDCSDLNEIFALSYILKLLDYRKFENFLSRHRVTNTKKIFDGFLFLTKTVSRSLLEQVSRGWSLNLPENYTFSRALHRGVPLEKIKNSSRKVVFVKNLHKMLRALWKSADSATFARNYHLVQRTVLDTIQSISETHVELLGTFEKYGKEKVVRRLAILYALIALTDAGHGLPKGYFFSLSKTETSDNYISKVFLGYKLTLSFVWEEILNQESIAHTELTTKLRHSRNWQSLDSLFELANESVVMPLEKEFDLSFGFGKYFRIKKPIPTGIWNKNLFKKPTEPTLSRDEDLQQELFWYAVQAMPGMYIFNGVTTFSSLLSGIVKMKKAYGNDEETFVIRFVHPVAQGKNDYSYGILVESFGTIGDYSGWLIFYDCCGDYSGFAGGEHRFAESIIEKYSKMMAAKVIEYQISSEDLLDYLRVFSAEITDTYPSSEMKIPVDGEVKKHKQLLKSLSSSSIIAKQNSTINVCKGCLLELLVHYFFADGHSRVRWRYRKRNIIGDEEIDIVARNESGYLYFVSCMSSLDIGKIERLIDESAKLLSHKEDLVKDFGEFESAKNVVFLPDDLSSSERKKTKKFNAEFYSLRRLFRESDRFAPVKKTDLTSILWETAEDRQFPFHRGLKRFF